MQVPQFFHRYLWKGVNLKLHSHFNFIYLYRFDFIPNYIFKEIELLVHERMFQNNFFISISKVQNCLSAI